MSRRSGITPQRLGQSPDEGLVDADRVEHARASMPAPDELLVLADTFGLLGDPGRLRLLVALLEGGEMCVGDLAAAAAQTESGASHALRLLRAHHVVAVRRTGRLAYYRLADGHVRMLLDLALTHARHADIPASSSGASPTTDSAHAAPAQRP